MVGQHHRLNELQKIMEDRGAWRATDSPWDRRVGLDLATEQQLLIMAACSFDNIRICASVCLFWPEG